ncbi:MAG: hypothetical protein AAFO73_06985, partial [Pseudomonadota bacterium]
MADDQTLWEIERGFWLKGASHYRAHLHEACVFAFPEPTGLMRGTGFVEQIGEYSPWASVRFHEDVITRPSDAMAVLAYRAVGTRHDGDPYEAFCTTTYALALHEAGGIVQ